jgi:hypothetical protein
MRKCPKCGELIGENVDSCFKCGTKLNFNRQSLKQQLITSSINDLYEYEVVSVTDDVSGVLDIKRLSTILKMYASEGWRLKTTITNEIGKNTIGVAIGSVGTGTNATIDQTVLIFERRIETAESVANKLKDKIDSLQELEEKEKGNAYTTGITMEERLIEIIKKSEQPLKVNDICVALDNKYSTMDILTYLQRLVEKGLIKKANNLYSV